MTPAKPKLYRRIVMDLPRNVAVFVTDRKVYLRPCIARRDTAGGCRLIECNRRSCRSTVGGGWCLNGFDACEISLEAITITFLRTSQTRFWWLRFATLALELSIAPHRQGWTVPLAGDKKCGNVKQGRCCGSFGYCGPLIIQQVLAPVQKGRRSFLLVALT